MSFNPSLGRRAAQPKVAQRLSSVAFAPPSRRTAQTPPLQAETRSVVSSHAQHAPRSEALSGFNLSEVSIPRSVFRAGASADTDVVQAAGWRSLLGLGVGVAAGGLLGAAVLGAGGLVAGASLGASAGAAVGRRFGRLGAGVGGLVGGLGGAAVGLGLGGGALLGAALGAAAGGVIGLRNEPAEALAPPAPSSLGALVHHRAVTLSGGPLADFTKHLEPELLTAMTEHFQPNAHAAPPTNDQISAFIDQFYAARSPADGPKVAPKELEGPLTQCLRALPFIMKLLPGGALTRARQERAPDADQKEAPARSGLVIRGEQHTNVERARGMFNQLVDRDLPPIETTRRDALVESGMGHRNDLHLGLVSPPGVILHELGHHLEHNLSPMEFGSLHNYLRRRAVTPGFRRVGYESLLGAPQNSPGYNLPMPAHNLGPRTSSAGFVASAVPYALGSKGAEGDIERFVVHHANAQESSYATMVYAGTHDTEYLSTTIHFFSNPVMAAELVDKDPFRVALFLSLAQPKVYAQLKRGFAEQTKGANLDPFLGRLGDPGGHTE